MYDDEPDLDPQLSENRAQDIDEYLAYWGENDETR